MPNPNINRFEPEIRDLQITIREARNNFRRQQKDIDNQSRILSRREHVIKRSRDRKRPKKLPTRPASRNVNDRQGTGGGRAEDQDNIVQS